MSLTRKMQRGLQARQRQHTKAVRRAVDELTPFQRQRVLAWTDQNPGRTITPDLVRSIAMGLNT